MPTRTNAMTEHVDYRTTTASIAEGLDRSTEIAIAATEVVKSITSVLVPLSVFMLPNSETLIPAIDKVVDRNFGVVLKVVEWQHQFVVAALGRLGPLASN
jgi:hypothetical protein